jgi:mannose-6-phosphate isomerase-like protein (cupin superfamily)
MVFSEIEGFEQVTVAAGATLQAPAHPYTEQMIFAVRGRAVADVAGARLHLEAGEVLMLGVGGPHTLTNDGGEPLELLSIEFIPTQIADRLPPRTPQLVDAA